MIEDAGIVGEDDDVGPLGQEPRNLRGRGSGIENDRIARLDHRGGEPSDPFLLRRMQAALGIDRRLVRDSNHPRRDGSAIAAHQHSALLEEREVLPDGLGRDAELLGEREHLGAAFGIQHPDDFLTSPAGVPHCSSLTQI